MTEPVRPLEALKIAEAIVRGHEHFCAGHTDPEQPWCSCAPEGMPLCAACSKLRDAIAAALLQAAAPPAPTADVIKFLRNRARTHYIKGGLEHEIRASECDALADGFEEELAEAAPPERVSEGKAVCEWVADSDGTDLYETSCGEDFVALEGCELDFVKFCCYCGKPARVLLEPDPARPAVEPREEPR